MSYFVNGVLIGGVPFVTTGSFVVVNQPPPGTKVVDGCLVSTISSGVNDNVCHFVRIREDGIIVGLDRSGTITNISGSTFVSCKQIPGTDKHIVKSAKGSTFIGKLIR